MTNANRIRLEKAARELDTVSKCRQSAQDSTLMIYRALELIVHVLTDLALRPDVNTP
jgi:hypothetical protein